MEPQFSAREITNRQFSEISSLLYNICGIRLSAGKEVLVQSRLMKRLRILGIERFDHYLTFVQEDRSGQELSMMIDALTTNKTSFFRESAHFEFLEKRILPQFRNGDREFRIWSTACSSGEEPYSIALLLKNRWPGGAQQKIRILATDISAAVLNKAREAIYSAEAVSGIPPDMLQCDFTIVRKPAGVFYRLNDSIKKMVHIARLNLMADWPMSGHFDLIFCRNVMIYFDKETQHNLVLRLWDRIAPGGHLFVGHSESLTAACTQYKYVQPAVYQKIPSSDAE
jgi:chemotaxis protein methyltransferase CheR